MLHGIWKLWGRRKFDKNYVIKSVSECFQYLQIHSCLKSIPLQLLACITHEFSHSLIFVLLTMRYYEAENAERTARQLDAHKFSGILI